MSRDREITDDQWAALAPHLPPQRVRTGHPAKGHNPVVEAILWRLCTGTPWRDLPEWHGPWQRAYSRFRRWRNVVGRGRGSATVRLLYDAFVSPSAARRRRCPFLIDTFVPLAQGKFRYKR